MLTTPAPSAGNDLRTSASKPRSYDLHGIRLLARSPDTAIWQRMDAVFAPFSASAEHTTSGAQYPDIVLDLCLVQVDDLPPWQPAGEIVSQSHLLCCTLDDNVLSAHFPRWGTVTVDLAMGVIRGQLLPAILNHYGAFDDMMIIVLGPLLRRRGLFSLHAFAAAHDDQAVLLVGDIGAGKTTTGLSLLEAGWRLVSNDSPLLGLGEGGVLVHAYPGLLAAYDDTLRRFPSLHRFLGDPVEPAAKRVFAAQEAYGPGIWQQQAPARLVLFPQIEPRLMASRVESITQPEALLALVPNSIERWDRDYIAEHLAVLQALVRQAPAYRLLLGPDVLALPGLIESLLSPAEKG